MFRSLIAVASIAVVLAYTASAQAGPTPSHSSGFKSKSDVHQVQFRGRTSRRSRCVAVGRRARGRIIPGVRGVGRGRGACRQAMSECRHDLRRNQRRGRNRRAFCEIARS